LIPIPSRACIHPPRRANPPTRHTIQEAVIAPSQPMEEDLIVVDDLDSNTHDVAGPSKVNADAQTTQAAVIGRPQRAATLRARRQSSPAYSDSADTTPGRPVRSSAKTKAAPKLKLKLSEKAAALAPGMSFLGPYDRELDSDDEELSFEEQFILRIPPGEDCGRLREMVAAREISSDVWFKFKGTSPKVSIHQTS
jgi:transcription initiation factor TFIID subunit 7